MEKQNNTTKLVKEIELKLAKIEELNRQIINASQYDFALIIDTVIENHKKRY